MTTRLPQRLDGYYRFAKVQLKRPLHWLHYHACVLLKRPYFGPFLYAMCASATRTRHMHALAGQEARVKGKLRILEVGTWAGSSAIIWANYASEVVCVDPWVPYVRESGGGCSGTVIRMDHLLRNDRIFNLFRHNIAAAGVAHIVRPLRGLSSELLPRIQGQTFDLIYIDGDHSYASTRLDLLNCSRLLASDGILCGDDLELQLENIDGDYARTNRERDYVIDPLTGKPFHPGVAVGVAEFFGGLVWAKDGFWAMRKTADGWVAPAA